MATRMEGSDQEPIVAQGTAHFTPSYRAAHTPASRLADEDEHTLRGYAARANLALARVVRLALADFAAGIRRGEK